MNATQPTLRRGREGLSTEDVDRVRRVLWLNGLRGADLDDAAQEVRLRFVERAPERLEAPGAWACKVATHLALDYHRRARRKDAAEARLRVVTASDGDDVALAQAVAAALQRLDPELRAVVVLRFYADLTVPDIAAELGIPVGTVKSRLHRAVGELRQALPEETLQ